MAKEAPQKKVIKVRQAGTGKFWQRKNFTEWLVFGLAFLLYVSIIGGGYNMDDELVTENHRLTSKGISAIPEIFSSPYYQDQSGYSYEYRPVVLTTFAIEHTFFGDNAHVSHFFNVLFYALCCLVLFRVLQLLFKNYSPLLAFAVSLLFIVHPAHTEVVCSIKNRDEILGLTFGLLALHVSLKGIDTGKRGWFVLTPVFFALALMSKITFLSFVVVIPIALMLFTGAGWVLVTLLEISMLTPAFFLLDLNSGSTKQILFAAVLLGVSGFYAILHFEDFKAGFVAALKALKQSVFGGSGVAVGSEVVAEAFSPKDLFKGIIPGRELLAALPIIVTLTLSVTYLELIAHYLAPFALIAIVALIFLAWLGNETMSWWATVMIGLCISGCVALNLFSAGLDMMNMYCRLVGFYLVFQLYYGKRTLFIPTAITFILFNFLSIYYSGNYDALFFPFILFFNQRYVRYVMLVILFFWSKDLYPFKNKYDYLELAGNLTAMIMMLSVQFKKGMKLVPWALVIAAVTWFHYYQNGHNQEVRVDSTVSAIKSVSDQVNPKVIAAPQNRPLNFIEEAVDLTTPRTIRLGTSLEILFHYLTKVVMPYPMSYYYGYKYITPQKISDPLPLVSLVLHLLLFIIALYFLKKDPLISFGLLVYLLSVVIFSNYFQPVPGMFGERFLLIPSLGWSVMLAVILQKIFRLDMFSKTLTWLTSPVNARYGFGAILVLYGVMTFARSLDWYNDIKLMRHDINVVPESVQAHNVLGIHLVKSSFNITDSLEQRKVRIEALGHLQTANALYPNYFNFVYDIGRVYSLLNMPDSVLFYFKQAMPLNPDYLEVPTTIANIYLGRNDFENAIPYFTLLIKKNPGDFNLFDKLSFIYFRSNRFDLSIQTNRDAIKLLPGRVDPYINIATCYLKRTDGYNATQGKDSAIVWLNRALVASPGNPAVTDYLKKIK